jgi:hypothetical protein
MPKPIVIPQTTQRNLGLNFILAIGGKCNMDNAGPLRTRPNILNMAHDTLTIEMIIRDIE